MEKIIKEKISSLLSEEEEVLSVEQLGGMTNQNYLAKTTNKQYIVKFFGKGTEKLINRQDEKYNLELYAMGRVTYCVFFYFYEEKSSD